MANEDYKAFLPAHGASRVSELDKEGLLTFAEAYMDEVSSTSISRLIREVDGITPDWKEVASWVEKAFMENKRFRYSVIEAESFDPKYTLPDCQLEYGVI